VPYQPRVRDEIERGLVARTVARAKPRLTDITPGGVTRTILRSVAEDFEAIEFRLKAIRDAFFLRGKSADLDDRLTDLPKGFGKRLGASAATGSDFQVERLTTSGNLVVPAGSVYGHRDDPSLVYIQTADVTILDGFTTATAVPVACATRGSAGNASSNTVTLPLSVPSAIVACSNTGPITGGVDRESDDELGRRVQDFLAGLAGVMPASVAFLARSHQAADGRRLRHVSIFEDPERPSYAELVVDDGTGLTADVANGATSSGTIPTNGQSLLWCESPMVGLPFIVERDSGGGWASLLYGPDADLPWTVIEERGQFYLRSALNPFAAGDQWRIRGYKVYTGIIRELQAIIEGHASSSFDLPGYRSSGCRLRVVPPRVQWTPIRVAIIAQAGTNDLAALRIAVRDEIIAFMQGLSPGAPLLLTHLGRALMRVPGVYNYVFQTPSGDVYPVDARTALRTRSELAEVV
jgi:hypothetical protein